MALKVGICRAAAGTGSPPFTQNFTDSGAGFSSDVKAVIFIGGNTTSDHSTQANAQFQFAMAATTGSAGVTQHAKDGATTDTYAGRYVNSVSSAAYEYALPAPDYYKGKFSMSASGSWPSNGVQVTWSEAQATQGLIYALLLGGDIEAVVLNGKFTGTGANEDVTKAHGLAGAPELLIFLSGAVVGTDSNNQRATIGFWDGTSSVSIDRNSTGLENKEYVASSVIGADRCAGGTVDYTAQTVNATNVVIRTSATSSNYFSVLALRGTTSPIVAKCGVHSTATGTGDAAMSLGMSVAPQVLLTLPTIMTAVDSVTSDDTGDVLAAFIAVNQGGTTLYGGATSFTDDGVATVLAKTQSSNSQVLRLWDTSPAIDVEATVKASTGWGSGDITLNYSNVGASAFKVPYLAFGAGAAPKYLKLLANSSAASDSSVEGVVVSDDLATFYGSFSGQAFEASLESGEAVLLVPTADISPDGATLTTSDTPLVAARNTTDGLVGLVSATVIEV